MSSIKLKHSGGNGVIIAAPSSNPASDRTLTVPSNADGTILTTTNPKAGNIIQVITITKNDTDAPLVNDATFYNYDDASLKVTITPTSASNKILLIGTLSISVHTNATKTMARFHKNGSVITAACGAADGNRASCMSAHDQTDLNHFETHNLSFQEVAGDTNSRYYNFAFAHAGGGQRAIGVNRSYNNSNNFYDTRGASTLTVMEIAA